MKYYVVVVKALNYKNTSADEILERRQRLASLRRLGVVVEWAEAYQAWCAEFDNAEDAALFKLTHA